MLRGADLTAQVWAAREAGPPVAVTVFVAAVKEGDFAAVRQLLSEDPGLARYADELRSIWNGRPPSAGADPGGGR